MKAKYFSKLISITIAIYLFLLFGCSNTVNNDNNIEIKGIYPNPLSNNGNIHFRLYKKTSLSIKIVDFYGREVKSVMEDNFFDYGEFMVDFDMTNKPSGIYNCIIKSNGEISDKQFSKY